ncbi:MAG: DedA family protein [Bacteroidales bacterium]|jgi:membrane protein YqaA with SNARE-associated domain|nr:DedA family protein [Bacteroidales bacterium]
MESLIKLGYLGLFLSSFLASTVIPLSSDVVLSALIALKFEVWICIIVATAGNFLGGLTTYGLGYLGKWKWIEKYFKKTKEDIEKFQHKVQKAGIIAAAFAWLPFIGDLIALALGFLRFKPLPVFIMMLIGRFCRFAFVGLIIAYILGQL